MKANLSQGDGDDNDNDASLKPEILVTDTFSSSKTSPPNLTVPQRRSHSRTKSNNRDSIPYDQQLSPKSPRLHSRSPQKQQQRSRSRSGSRPRRNNTTLERDRKYNNSNNSEGRSGNGYHHRRYLSDADYRDHSRLISGTIPSATAAASHRRNDSLTSPLSRQRHNNNIRHGESDKFSSSRLHDYNNRDLKEQGDDHDSRYTPLHDHVRFSTLTSTTSAAAAAAGSNSMEPLLAKAKDIAAAIDSSHNQNHNHHYSTVDNNNSSSSNSIQITPPPPLKPIRSITDFGRIQSQVQTKYSEYCKLRLMLDERQFVFNRLNEAFRRLRDECRDARDKKNRLLNEFEEG